MKPPIIICGAPRSGTQFHRTLISTARKCLITSEINRGLIEKLAFLDEEVRLYVKQREKRQHSLDRRAWWCISFWLSMQVAKNVDVAKVLEDVLSGKVVIGNKTPSSELFLDFYTDIFAPAIPKVVYCLRSPVANFASRRSMPWRQKTVQEMVQRFLTSIRMMEEYRTAHPDNVFVAQLDVLAPTGEAREDYARRLLDFCGLSLSRNGEEFVAGWAPVGHRERVKGERKSYKEVFTKNEVKYMLGHDQFRTTLEQYGYELGEEIFK